MPAQKTIMAPPIERAPHFRVAIKSIGVSFHDPDRLEKAKLRSPAAEVHVSLTWLHRRICSGDAFAY